VIAIDTVTERLALAKEAGAETLDFMHPLKAFGRNFLRPRPPATTQTKPTFA
jgi:hypothetical protein